MATTVRTGRRVTDLSGECLLLPQGGMPDPAPEGAIVLEGGSLYVWTLGEWWKVTMTQADSGISADSNAKVSNAGAGAVNGTYTNKGATWEKGGGTAYIISKQLNYPTPGTTSWVLRTSADTIYSAPSTNFPWEATWVVDSFGTAPPPTVIGLPKVVF
jgi:hypothetical protein